MFRLQASVTSWWKQSCEVKGITLESGSVWTGCKQGIHRWISCNTTSDQQGGNRKKNAVVKFKMKKKNPQTIKVTISLHKILHWSLFYSCSNKAEHVKAARQTSGSDVQPKDKERFCLGLWELKMSDLFCMFNMFTFSVTVCQRDWEAAKREGTMEFQIARSHPFRFTAHLWIRQKLLHQLSCLHFVMVRCFELYTLKPRVLKLRKQAERSDLQRG